MILHDGIPDPTRSIAALPAILAAGRRKGLEFVPIGTLMAGGRGPGGPGEDAPQ